MQPINIPELKEGETYAGAIIKPDGTGHHIILLTGDKDNDTWKSVMDWAKKQGGDLPNRAETAILFSQSKDQFKTNWYWTSEQHASISDYAWCQGFTSGTQDYYNKHDKMRARAVRRVAI